MRGSALASVIGLAMVAAVFAASPAAAQRAQEDAVKATFLTRFASFIEYPAGAFVSAEAPLVICVSGDPSIAALTEQAAANQRIDGRPLEVRRVGAVDHDSGCHVIYLAGVDGQSVSAALGALRGVPVLTVTDGAHGRTRGAIHFVLSDGRVRFHIDRNAADAGRLGMSARLLNIALSVRGGAA